MAQSGPGRIELFDNFRSGAQQLVASTTAPPISVGNGTFSLVGQGLADTDSGGVLGTKGITLTATNEAEHAAGLTTRVAFDVATNGTIVAETYVEFNNLDTKEFFFGFSDVQTDLAILEGAIAHGATTTFTLTASDICGFWLSSELTDDEAWHAIHNGGTATGVTDSTALTLGVDAVAGERDLLRLEIDNNGTARWFLNGVLKKTLEGAVSTTVDLACSLIVEEKVTGNASCVVDYLMVKANRDWTR